MEERSATAMDEKHMMKVRERATAGKAESDPGPKVTEGVKRGKKQRRGGRQEDVIKGDGKEGEGMTAQKKDRGEE